MSVVLPPDLELWLCQYLRSKLTDVPGVQVGNKRPDPVILPDTVPLVTIRDDGGYRDDFAAFDRSIGVNVYGWSRSNDKPCKDLARRVFGLLADPDIATVPGSPIINVDGSSCNGPYPVTEDEQYAHYYLIIAYTVIGEY
ncbi:hypothetical protein BW13_00925 [Bifidobacterium sp. UTCIF-37]|uniref:hypothetical protein n=1 Tax=unclassified Bifidobacterium TaxID=2608897 RepID=UPI00112D712D|nr:MULTISPECIES: hypothetical protein [unclassified Bifidobacterium]TPF87445.1 hypothetical protein BW13_00925 [Bifidobacterium sp. UTCIF-37]TPF91221.1 hypothetical protein BW11_00925 [Bifidobacterium sp. UTCIF-38]